MNKYKVKLFGVDWLFKELKVFYLHSTFLNTFLFFCCSFFLVLYYSILFVDTFKGAANNKPTANRNKSHFKANFLRFFFMFSIIKYIFLLWLLLLWSFSILYIYFVTVLFFLWSNKQQQQKRTKSIIVIEFRCCIFIFMRVWAYFRVCVVPSGKYIYIYIKVSEQELVSEWVSEINKNQKFQSPYIINIKIKINVQVCNDS